MTMGTTTARTTLLVVAIFLIWLILAAIGIFEIYLVRESVLAIFASLGGEYFTAVTVSQAAVLISVVLFVIFLLASLEFHLKHKGTRKSWRAFGWTFGVEVFILIAAYLIN